MKQAYSPTGVGRYIGTLRLRRAGETTRFLKHAV